MKCTDAQLNILLAQAEELSPELVRELEEHLVECDACREHQKSFDMVVSTVREILPSGEPSGATLANIRTEAGRSNGVFFWRPGFRALAYAASLAVILGGWMLMSIRQEPRMTHDLDTIIMIMHGQDDESVAYDNFEQQDLVDQLLIIEGFELEDLEDTEWLNSDDDLPATGLQSHSIPVPVQRICV